MTDEPRSRRDSDVRLLVLERDVKEVISLVKQIDSALRFPEQSPVGRALIDRADRNQANIHGLRTDVTVIEASVDLLQKNFDELNGVVKALRTVSLLVGITLGIFTLFQLVNP